mmetsp:Transcript_22561/g.31413  ORF Transcript_22561/g.31413 Transcript_22561/m.31413 type:complete len:447 (-) Transcript_22561:176-1516(-)
MEKTSVNLKSQTMQIDMKNNMLGHITYEQLENLVYEWVTTCEKFEKRDRSSHQRAPGKLARAVVKEMFEKAQEKRQFWQEHDAEKVEQDWKEWARMKDIMELASSSTELKMNDENDPKPSSKTHHKSKTRNRKLRRSATGEISRISEDDDFDDEMLLQKRAEEAFISQKKLAQLQSFRRLEEHNNYRLQTLKSQEAHRSQQYVQSSAAGSSSILTNVTNGVKGQKHLNKYGEEMSEKELIRMNERALKKQNKADLEQQKLELYERLQSSLMQLNENNNKKDDSNARKTPQSVLSAASSDTASFSQASVSVSQATTSSTKKSSTLSKSRPTSTTNSQEFTELLYTSSSCEEAASTSTPVQKSPASSPLQSSEMPTANTQLPTAESGVSKYVGGPSKPQRITPSKSSSIPSSKSPSMSSSRKGSVTGTFKKLFGFSKKSSRHISPKKI